MYEIFLSGSIDWINFLRSLALPYKGIIFSFSENFSNSFIQLKIKLVGATIKIGLSIFKLLINEIVSRVFPKPISSAKTPPTWFLYTTFNHLKASIWYGLKVALRGGNFLLKLLKFLKSLYKVSTYSSFVSTNEESFTLKAK